MSRGDNAQRMYYMFRTDNIYTTLWHDSIDYMTRSIYYRSFVVTIYTGFRFI